MYQNDFGYRQASLDAETQIGLLTLVYEALAADLRQAAQALQDHNIQRRCNASNHALELLGHIETWAEDMEDITLSKGLKQFYGFLRARIVALQTTGTREDFEGLSRLVLEIRSTWQEKGRQVAQSPGPLEAVPDRTSESGDQGRTASAWMA